jgi:Tol biopolymer transport system component/DNA-binding winged helix-turn-helix (wHTH) protein
MKAPISKQANELYEFGPFRVDLRECLLLREGEALPLTPKAFETLVVLLQNAGHLMPKEELMKRIWPDSYVEEVNLSQNISMLRKALGDQAQGSRYIVTVPGRGYRFTEKVRLIPERDRVEEGEIVFQSRAITQVVIDEEAFTDAREMPAAEGAKARNRPRTLVFGAAVLILAFAAVAFRPSVQAPKVTRIRQLTHLGNLIQNVRLLTDGPRVYFRALEGKDRVIRYVSNDGGQVFSIAEPFPEMDIVDMSPSGSEFLVVNFGDVRTFLDSKSNLPSLWRVPIPSGSPRPVGDVHARDARWSPDGSKIAYSAGSNLYLVSPDGSNVEELASLPDEPIHLVWSPDGKYLRFALEEQNDENCALWEVDVAKKTLRRLLPNEYNSVALLAGGWTPDNRYFFYASGDATTENIWAMRQEELLRRTSRQPMQITTGPLGFFVPLSGRDGKTIFSVGQQLRGQLVRYDARARQFVPYAQGISADHITFSRDGQWMAYIDFTDAVLVRSRIDGSERRQLTFLPMRASNPQWSPDATQIAFQCVPKQEVPQQDVPQPEVPRICLVPADGGAPTLAVPEGPNQQLYPSWAPDGASLLFSGSDVAGSHPALYRVDVNTKHVSPVRGSEGLRWGQLSPDGRYIAALEDKTKRVILFDLATRNRRVLSQLADYPRWSADGEYVYFSTLYFNPYLKQAGIYRCKVSTNVTELVTPAPDFNLAGIWGISYGLAPDNSTLVLRDLSTRDIYALDMELP